MRVRYNQLQSDFTRRWGCWGRALLLIGVAFACMLFACGGSLLLYVLVPPGPVTVLVLGLDAREGEGFVTRTDTVMLLNANPRKLDASLLSIPRDLMIDVPGYGRQRINTVNVLGEMEEAGRGPHLLSDGIAQSFNVQPDAYLRMNFDAFRAMIDAVGGVTINVERAIVDDQYPTDDFGYTTIRFDPGRVHMDGDRALTYARTRHGDDDYARAGRQQQVLTAFARKAIVPLYWPALLNALRVHVDTNLTPGELLTIAPAVLINAGRFDRLVIDREYIVPVEGGAAPDYAKISPWLDAHFR